MEVPLTGYRRDLTIRARRKYINELSKVIRGQPSALFRQPGVPSLVLTHVQSNTGSAILESGTPNQTPMSLAMKQASDRKAAAMFMYPDTDPLAYSRRIETPQVFSHSPRYGF